MKAYPSIPSSKKAPIGNHCIAFYKYDGSNLRYEWSKKKGFHKYGTRRRLFDENDEVFGNAIPLFHETMAQSIQERVIEYCGKTPERVTVFCEYLGDGSFAGKHKENDAKYLKLIDVAIYKKGMIPAEQFVDVFGDMDYMAKEIYRGPLTEQFINDVRTGVIPLNEGVICKGGEGHKSWMVKIKTFDYLKRLKESEKNWQAYWE